MSDASGEAPTRTVGVIGGAGFIGSHVTKKFLDEGYRVRVSASDSANTAKYAHLDAFLPGCHIVVHGGTPFQLAEQELGVRFRPAREALERYRASVPAS